MASTPDHLIEWLRDAQSLEEQADTMLSKAIERIEHYPDVKRELDRHVQATRRQSEALRRCIERLGDGAPTADLASDEIVQAAMSVYVVAQREIAAYTVLVTAARIVGDRQTAAICQAHLKEGERMADWLRTHMPAITEKYLGRSAVGVEAGL